MLAYLIKNKKDDCVLCGNWTWSCMYMYVGFGELLTQQNKIIMYY